VACRCPEPPAPGLCLTGTSAEYLRIQMICRADEAAGRNRAFQCLPPKQNGAKAEVFMSDVCPQAPATRLRGVRSEAQRLVTGDGAGGPA
jgi:hypothetical protein